MQRRSSCFVQGNVTQAQGTLQGTRQRAHRQKLRTQSALLEHELSHPKWRGLNPSTVCLLCCFEILLQLSAFQGIECVFFSEFQLVPGTRISAHCCLNPLCVLQAAEHFVPPGPPLMLLWGQAALTALRA